MPTKTLKSASLDMTQGSPFKLIATFAFPLLLGNALQQLYNMVDSVVVGQFVGHTALAAVGLSFPVFLMMASMFIGLSNGTMVIVSQFYGAGDQKQLSKTIDTVYTALIIGSIPLSIIGMLLAGPILTLLQAPPDARNESYTYLLIVLGGLVGPLGYNLNSGILQGVGDSRTPLLFLTISCAINIVLDLVLVLVFPLGVAGVAIATITAQMFSWIFGIFYINKRYPQLRIRPFSFKFDKRLFAQILRLGVPAGIQMSLFSIATLMLSRLVNSYGSVFAAGYAAANKLDTFAFLPIQSITNAVTAFTGQNVGAGRLDRVYKGAKSTLIMCLIVSAIGLLLIPAGPILLRMFTNDPAVIEAGMAYISRILPFYWMLATLFTVNNTIRGAGDPVLPMLSAVLSLLLLRVPAAYLLAEFFGKENIYFAYPIGWVLGMIISISYFFSGKWKNKGITRAGSNISPIE